MLDSEIINDSFVCLPSIESVWLKLNFRNSKPTLLNIVYRPPNGSLQEFHDIMNQQIEQFHIEPTAEISIMGDINIDFLKPNMTTYKLNDFLKEKNLDQLITRATRFTDTTATLLDHIYTNSPDLYSHKGVLEPGLSDHSLIFVCHKRQKLGKGKKTIIIRNYHNFNANAFNNDIEQADWTEVFSSQTFDEMVSVFNFIIMIYLKFI